MDGHTLNAANDEQRRLTSLINSMADGVIAINSDGNITLYNGAALNILNINNSLANKPLNDVLHLVSKELKPLNVLELIRGITTTTASRDYKLAYPDGSTINLYVSIAPVHVGYGDNRGPGYVLTLRDITREKALEEERDDFISVVSHELRNPVAIVEGNISNAIFTTEKTGDIPAIKHALETAYEQTVFLASLIEDLATLSRAERGALDLSIDAINAHQFIEELTESYRPQAEKKGLSLHTEIDPSLELFRSSKLYLREVLQNFITNAVKYTEHGSVTIGAKPQNNGVVFTVRDTGIGISTADKARLFDKFFRSDDPRTRKVSGTGLGLYVTMKLAHLLQARIHLESELNKGTVFSIFIPNLQPGSASDQTLPAASSEPQRP